MIEATTIAKPKAMMTSFSFLLHRPGAYTSAYPCTMKTGVPGFKFYRSMTITRTTHQFPFVVTLYWTRDCGIMQLWFRPKDGVDVHQWAGIFDDL
jgi:hypothetical protein